MTRAPLAAWRPLFAIGGAPAASHAALSRAPSSDRLLDPLREARVVNDTSLDALARPIDVANVLSRVVDAVTATDAPAGDLPNVVARRPRVDAPTQTNVPARRSVAAGESATSSRARAVFPTEATKTATVATSFAAPRPEARRGGPLAPRGADSPSRREMPLAGAGNAISRRNLSSAAGTGSCARVLLDSPVVNVDRLLSATGSDPGAPRAYRSPRQSESVSTPSDVGQLLADAVDRVNAVRADASAAPLERVRSGSSGQSTAPFDQPRVAALPVVASAEELGGFRGLAHRTLAQPTAVERSRAPRIEPEARTSSDLAADTLDARVADSLARVLEREARRHGIDLSEAGA